MNSGWRDDVLHVVVIIIIVLLISLIAYLAQPKHIIEKNNVMELIENNQCVEIGKSFNDKKQMVIHKCQDKIYIL